MDEIVKAFKVLDSGMRQKFETGAQRDTRDGKGRFDLVPPCCVARMAALYEKGALKYDDHNWEKGMPASRFLDSALRHINKYQEGLRVEDHLAAAVFNIFGIIFLEEMVRRGSLPEKLLDLPNYYAFPEDSP